MVTKLLNMGASFIELERKYQLLGLEDYRFHAYENERLYKEKGKDTKVVLKFIECVFTRFEARHSVIIDRSTQFKRVFKRVPNSLG